MAQALVNLRVSLNDLRHALGAESARLHAPERSSRRAQRALVLDLEGADVDLIDFDAAVTRGDRMSLAAAVSLYRGPLLEGCSEEWALPERERREQAYLLALEALAGTAMSSGESARAEQYLRLAVTVDPFRESAWRELMQALAIRGNYAAALHCYRELRLRLHRELNSAPDPRTQALFERIRDRVPGAAVAEPAAGASFHCPGNLPAPTTSLLGRERELADLGAILVSKTTRLVTLTGPGGTGKTRLAIEAAATLCDRFCDGVFFVSLAAIRDPGLVATAIAETLAIREEPGRPVNGSLLEALREKQILLLLDNLEQVLPAALLVAEILAAAPRVRVLVTSRAALRLRGERLFPVMPLSLPGRDCMPSLAALSEYAAVALFLERARDVKPDLTVTDENAPAIVEICRRLDGLPLAIELAAARMRLLSPEVLLSQLGSRLRLLTGGYRDMPSRQQTLRGAIGWSYDLLTKPEKRLFRSLSVFADGWTLESAEAVCSSESDMDLQDGVTSLVDKNLLRREGSGREPRFGMLETIREFGLEQLRAAGEMEAVRQRHAQAFLDLAEEAHLNLHGPEESAWLHRLDREHDNLRAAMETLSQEAAGEMAQRLALALMPYWTTRGYLREGRTCLEALLRRRGNEDPSSMRAELLRRAGRLALMQADYTAARSFYGESLAISRGREDTAAVASSLLALGQLFHFQGQYAQARAYFEESLALVQQAGDRRLLPGILFDLGNNARITGDFAQARSYCEQSIALCREQESTYHAWPLLCLGNIALAEADVAEARALYAEALQTFRATGYTWGVAFALDCHAALAATVGEQERAARLFGAAGALRETLGVVRPLDGPAKSEDLVVAARIRLAGETPALPWEEGGAMTMDDAVAYALNGYEETNSTRRSR
jgi:predicted ATPase/DNA-binding SARP family transcriptional activator